ncbi:MAG: bifunctional oligoribonuclease/PAP phosphatase NrnA [Bdellovibrionales bacterium]|nr:bifunctional oligoribonuclease/PAP phosphatase NrnA [Bdellovibrionales bacterium]
MSDTLQVQFGKARDLIQGASSIVIFTHVSPDADAFGSSCGLQIALQQAGKQVTCYNPDIDQSDYEFIPGVKDVRAFPEENTQPDIIVVCDCGELSRIGSELVAWVSQKSVPIVNIDHHITNDSFGTVNIVGTDFSSTAELVTVFLEFADIAIPPNCAEALLTGIVGDTGCFRYRSATSDTLRRAAALIDNGARLANVTDHLYGSVSLASIRLEALALGKLELLAGGKVAGVVITQSDLQDAQANSDDAGHLTEKIRDIEGVVVAYTIRWRDGVWKVSLRTANPNVDLARVAQNFGGGGHKAAAAFRFSRELHEMLPRLQAELIESLTAVA